MDATGVIKLTRVHYYWRVWGFDSLASYKAAGRYAAPLQETCAIKHQAF